MEAWPFCRCSWSVVFVKATVRGLGHMPNNSSVVTEGIAVIFVRLYFPGFHCQRNESLLALISFSFLKADEKACLHQCKIFNQIEFDGFLCDIFSLTTKKALNRTATSH